MSLYQYAGILPRLNRQDGDLFFIGCIKEVTRMKKELPIVHCEYADVEESLEKLIEASFLLYLSRVLAASECFAEWPPCSGGQNCTSK